MGEQDKDVPLFRRLEVRHKLAVQKQIDREKYRRVALRNKEWRRKNARKRTET